jgi:hypothetical protein
MTVDVDEEVDDELEVVLGVVDVDVVVTMQPPDVLGKLPGSAGSVPQSSSRRSNTPSSSRSTPMRTPEPGGTQVYVCSWPASPESARSAAVVMTPSAFRSGWKLLPPT